MPNSVPAAMFVPCSVSTSACRSVAKSPFFGFDDSAISMPRSRASISALTRLTPGAEPVFEQPGGERGREQARFLRREFALIDECGLADRAVGHLRVQQAEPAGQIDVRPHLREFRPIDGGHVDRVGDLPFQQEVDDELRRLDRDVLLRLDRGRAEVRRQHDVRGFQQRVVGRGRLGAEHVDAGPGDGPGRERVGERLLVDDAAAGDVQHARRFFISPSSRAPIRLLVSSVSGT